MNKTEVNNYITAWLDINGYGKGYRYWPIVDGRAYRTMTQARKAAEEGSEIICRIGPVRASYYHEERSFVVGEDPGVLKYYYKHKANSVPDSSRDYQKSRVYTFERKTYNHFDQRKRTEQEAQELVDKVLSYYGIYDSGVRVIVSNRKKVTSTYRRFYKQIVLAAGWGQRPRTILHETTHAILHLLKHPQEMPWHGPAFVSLVCEVYAMFLEGAPSLEKVYSELDKRGIDYIKDFNVLEGAAI